MWICQVGGTVLTGIQLQAKLSPSLGPLGPPVKTQQAIHRCCAYSGLKRPHQKPRSAASSVSLGAAQQVAPDSLRIHLEVAWVRFRVRGGRVSGNPLGLATPVIQFDDLTPMAALCPRTEWGEGSTRNNGYPWHSVQGKSRLRPHSDNVFL